MYRWSLPTTSVKIRPAGRSSSGSAMIRARRRRDVPIPTLLGPRQAEPGMRPCGSTRNRRGDAISPAAAQTTRPTVIAIRQTFFGRRFLSISTRPTHRTHRVAGDLIRGKKRIILPSTAYPVDRSVRLDLSCRPPPGRSDRSSRIAEMRAAHHLLSSDGGASNREQHKRRAWILSA